MKQVLIRRGLPIVADVRSHLEELQAVAAYLTRRGPFPTTLDEIESATNVSFFSVGPTVQFSSVHRFAASSHLAGPPTPRDGIHTISFIIDGLVRGVSCAEL